MSSVVRRFKILLSSVCTPCLAPGCAPCRSICFLLSLICVISSTVRQSDSVALRGGSSDFYQSETPEQRQYEGKIEAQQGISNEANAPLRSPSVTGGGDLEPVLRSMTISSEEMTRSDTSTSQSRPASEHKKRGRVRGKVRDFYQNVIKPAFPEAIQDLKIMSGISALEARVKREMGDPELHPEIKRVAEVRRGNDLCPEEQLFLARRKLHVQEHFAKYLGLDPAEVHPDDIPTISFGGSGGGFRALIGLLAYGEEMKKAGLWDLITYFSGVSGSCWSIGAYYTFGKCSHTAVIEHCKKRFARHHPLSGDAIRKMLSAPGGARVTLGPLIEKSKSGLQTVAMDLYSVFLTGWIFFQDKPTTQPDDTAETADRADEEVAQYQADYHRYSSTREHTDDGSQPLPILTAIRHERPWRDWIDKEHPFKEPDHAKGDHASARDAWYQWFEFTPYEIGCDEFAAWVPTWAFGRPFSEGKSTMQLPEQSMTLLLGLTTSALAGPLTSYWATISRNIPENFLGSSIHKMVHLLGRVWGKQGSEEFQNHHPLRACNEHNFLFRYSRVEQGVGRPPGLENSPRIHLIDSGMDNNCPTYVQMHPSRRADVLLNMDASSDVQKDAFQERIDQIGGRRGMKFSKRDPNMRIGPDPADLTRFDGLYAQIYDGVPCERPPTVVDSYGRTVTNPPAPVYTRESSMVYMPLLPNFKAVPGFDPSTAKFSGSYNLVWTPEQVETLVNVCVANFAEAEPTIKQILREAWQRRKAERERGEAGKPEVDPAAAAEAAEVEDANGDMRRPAN